MNVARKKGNTKAARFSQFLKTYQSLIALHDMLIMSPFVQKIVIKLGQAEDGIRPFEPRKVSNPRRAFTQNVKDLFRRTNSNKGEWDGENAKKVEGRWLEFVKSFEDHVPCFGSQDSLPISFSSAVQTIGREPWTHLTDEIVTKFAPKAMFSRLEGSRMMLEKEAKLLRRFN
jgi:hypothetical protein